jgi:phosphoribosylformylglycinamidine synthase subunit PurSL
MTVRTVPLLDASDDDLERISREGTLSLNLDEMRTIRAHFAEQGRDPTDVELETIAQTWSEHCVHKTFRGLIDYTENGKTETIDNLLRSTVARATHELDRDDCLSVFHDNAGVIRLNEEYGVAFKVETHNHPSAIEPYGGAGTGTGGVIRDILGTGLGAKPILNTDVFCFGLPDAPHEELPTGVLHPKRVLTGVVAGVRDYGNRMGIPTANGAVFFDPRYAANPLVFCGTVGLIPVDCVDKVVAPGDLIVAMGGRTGRDGIHGATFSSAELDDTSEGLGSVVQIGDPITEKKVADVLLQARDLGLFRSITDCGAGGFSSAVGEMGEETGARVHLERAPLKYEGLEPWEIWLSEAQERMVLAVPPEHEAELLALAAAEDVEATVLGEFTDTGRLEVYYHDRQVGELGMSFLHNGLPRIAKTAVWETPDLRKWRPKGPLDMADALMSILAEPNVASKEWIIRQYDHEVQGGMMIKPLHGVDADGPGDACVVRPVLGSPEGVAVSNGMNPRYGDVDPYWMAALAIDEALRNLVAVGGMRARAALLDNFSWGNPDKPDRLGGLVRAAKACYDFAKAFGTPFISGKDSLYNEYRDTKTGEQVAIPGTLLISAMCVLDDAEKVTTMDAKEEGDVVFLLGRTYSELGASHYLGLFGETGPDVPHVRPAEACRTMDAVHASIQAGLVNAVHDCSEGGVAVAAAEMAFAGGLGMELDLRRIPGHGLRPDEALFSESASRFIVTVPADLATRFYAGMLAIGLRSVGRLGVVTDSGRFVVRDTAASTCIDVDIADLKAAWQNTLPNSIEGATA